MITDRQDALSLGMPPTLDDVIDAYREMLWLPDPAPVYVALAALVANMIEEGDPVWLMLIAGSGRSKTEIIRAFADISGVLITSDVTEAGLLSGTARKEKAKDATGGLLRVIGERGTLVIKDFGSILSMNRDKRAAVIHALREIYDGHWVRDLGTDGCTRLEWEGKLGLIAATTTAIDQHHAVMSALGERWVSFRISEGGEEEMVAASVAMSDTDKARLQIRTMVRRYIEMLDLPERLRKTRPHELRFLQGLVPLVCTSRSPVNREGYGREISHVGDSEGPGRVARQLHKLLVGFEILGLSERATMTLLIKVALDSVPSPRRDVLAFLISTNSQQFVADVERATGLGTTMARRGLGDLHAQGVVHREILGDHEKAPHAYSLTPRWRTSWQQVLRAFPETSDHQPTTYKHS